jgi:hypothetical protein
MLQLTLTTSLGNVNESPLPFYMVYLQRYEIPAETPSSPPQ